MSYCAESARSGRSICRECRANIGNGELRIGKLVQSTRHKGMDTCWYHPRCFFSKLEGVVEFEISNMDELKEDDQNLLRKYLAGEVPLEAPSEEQAASASDEQDKNKGKDQVPSRKSGLDGIQNSGDFYVEYAKSNKSRCLSCERNISKNEVRISQKDYTSAKALMIPGRCLDRWYHLDCFVYNRCKFEFHQCADAIPGFANLKAEDKAVLLEKLPAVVDENNTRVEGTVEKDDEEIPEIPITPIERLKERIRAVLAPQNISSVLNYNKQNVPREIDKMVHSLADIMLSGAPARCGSCGGEYILRDDLTYQCIGFLSQLSATCAELQGSPARVPFSIPPDETDVEILFKEYSSESNQKKNWRLSVKRPLPLKPAAKNPVLKLRNV